MPQRFGVAWLAVALSATACAVYTSGIRPDAAVRPDRAYLYGRFFMNALADDSSMGGGGKQSMGLLVRCENGSSFTFGSKDKRDIQVLEIKPARCWLIEADLSDQNGILRKQVPAERAIQRPLDFTAGRAHYIGDFFAKGDYALQIGRGETWEWAMSSAAGDHYAETTAEMKRVYPNLAALPTDDVRLIPRAARKLGNGIGPSPGEPPLSPRMVAGLAGYIRRSYATPAQCEAACPAGQCLAYRGQSGTEMTCVVRCNRNADCPTGLLCTCPNSEVPAGPDCQPIAARPNDPLPRLCVTPETAGQP